MRKSFTVKVAIAFAAACMSIAVPAMADSPHFVKGPTYDATLTSLTATGKAAGLANVVTTAFLSAREIDVTYQCRNHGQNFAPGHPAVSTDVTGPPEQIAPHNGQITFSVSLPATPPSAADACPNANWTVVVSHVDYLGVVLHIQQNGQDILSDQAGDFHVSA
jgi:hypothetical protein